MSARIPWALAVAAIAAAACSSTQYIISTKDGHMVPAYGKPELDAKSGMYTYKDAEGRRATISKDVVVEILER
jgi:hypothetical protein